MNLDWLAASGPMDFSLHRTTRNMLAAAFLVGNLWLLAQDQTRTVAVILLLALLISISFLNRSIAICLTFGYLILLGDVRRLLSLAFGFPRFDILLLVGPTIAVWLSAPVLARLRLTNPLSKGVAALMTIMLLEVFNPKQGGISVGLAGAMFYAVPLLWFWIGRRYGNYELLERLLYKVVLPLGLAAAFLGLLQTFVGFLPWEQAWVDTKALSALNVSGFIRPFGFSVSASEYSRLLLFATALLLARLMSGQKLWGFLLPLPLAAIVLESSRNALLRVAIAGAVIWGLRRVHSKKFAFRFGLALAMLLGVLYLGASRVNPEPESRATGAQALLAHQAGGFSHPLDSKKSTVGLHMMYVTKGLVSGLKNPLGYGLGSTTDAASKIGGATADELGFATEFDFTDMIEAIGLVGGGIYLAVTFLALRSGFGFVGSAPRSIGLPVIGILAANVGNWLISGEYSSSALIWFLIGSTAAARPIPIKSGQTPARLTPTRSSAECVPSVTLR